MGMSDDEFLNLQEVELYLTIYALGDFVWRMNHDMAKPGRIPVEHHAGIRNDVAACQARMECAVDQAIRFTVGTPRETKTDAFTGEEFLGASDEYWLWFRWWDSWSKSLTDKQFREMDADITAKRDLAVWRPEGDWRVK